jgi:molybdate transport system regulatory protein
VLSRWQAAPHTGPALARLGVRTSMRNQLPGVVEQLVVQGQIVAVHLRLGLDFAEDASAPGTARAKAAPAALVSRITRESAELLGLQPGLAVQALCKATAVRVERGGRVASPAGLAVAGALQGAHRLPARATRVVRGAWGDEVSAELAGGLHMVGFAAPGSGLRVGSPVVVVVEDNAVVLALAEN